MTHKLSPWVPFLCVFAISVAHPWRICRADSSDEYDENGVKKSYYWQGSQLNNLERLGGNSDFEAEQHRAHEGKDADQYLASIRNQLARQARKNAQEKTALTFQGQLPGDPIELTALSPGLRVILHADALFDENSATMKIGVVDTLQRLYALLETTAQKPLQFVIADILDDVPEARDLDAERSLVILTMLQMPAKNADQENLTPEVLIR
jgi:hypothetical protein